MARIPKHRWKRVTTPGWLLTLEAFGAAVLIHATLFALAGYQPEKRTAAAPESPGVTLLSRSGFSGEEWEKLAKWISIHDPSQISRSDSPAGYVAMLEKRRMRPVEALRVAEIRLTPPLPGLPDYVPLAVAEGSETETRPFSGRLLTERSFTPPAPVRKPVIRDGEGGEIRLERLSVPAVKLAAERPTVVTVWGTPGFMRHHLEESSGVAELDRAVLEAVAGEIFDTRKTIVVYWPDAAPDVTGEEGP